MTVYSQNMKIISAPPSGGSVPSADVQKALSPVTSPKEAADEEGMVEAWVTHAVKEYLGSLDRDLSRVAEHYRLICQALDFIVALPPKNSNAFEYYCLWRLLHGLVSEKGFQLEECTSYDYSKEYPTDSLGARLVKQIANIYILRKEGVEVTLYYEPCFLRLMINSRKVWGFTLRERLSPFMMKGERNSRFLHLL